jgi:hypothetical protein
VLEDEHDLASPRWPARQRLYRERLRRLYERSRRILVSELRYALGVDLAEVLSR